jgi:hypothetical protein
LPDELRSLIEGRCAAIAGPVTSRRERIARATAIRRVNEAMQPWVESLRSDLTARRQSIRTALRSNRIARNREFASVLHSEGRLRAVLGGLANRSLPGTDIHASAGGG